MGGQALSQGQQVYYDADTGQYYTMNNGNKSNPVINAMFGIIGNSRKNYLNNLSSNASPVYKAPTVNPTPTIAELFPTMTDTSAIMNALASQGNPLVSYGAGRFLSPQVAQATGGVLNQSNKA